jgi:uncharacterized membrane protein
MIDFFNLWLHLLGLAVYFGSGVTLVVMFFPMASQITSSQERHRFLAQGLRIYNPLSMGALGVLLMTGAFNLTSYKALLRSEFFSRLGLVLGLKLLLVFLLINASAFVSVGLGHRLVRMHLGGETMEPEGLTRTLRRMRTFTIVALVLTGIIVFLSLNMTYLMRTPPS